MAKKWMFPKPKITILVLNQSLISAVFPIVSGDQKTALTVESLYYYLFLRTTFSFSTFSYRVCSVFSGAQAYFILENAVHTFTDA